MAGKDIPAAGQALTADATAAGVLTVTSTAGFRAGSKGNLSSATVAGVEVVVTEITDATHLIVRVVTPRKSNVTAAPDAGNGDNLRLNPISYGASDVSDYKLANTARIDCPRQFVYNEPLT